MGQVVINSAMRDAAKGIAEVEPGDITVFLITFGISNDGL